MAHKNSIDSLDGKTLSMAFIETSTLADAQTLVRVKNGKKINGRVVSVVLASQSELLSQVSGSTVLAIPELTPF